MHEYILLTTPSNTPALLFISLSGVLLSAMPEKRTYMQCTHGIRIRICCDLSIGDQRLRAHQANGMAIIAWVATDPSVGQNRDS